MGNYSNFDSARRLAIAGGRNVPLHPLLAVIMMAGTLLMTDIVRGAEMGPGVVIYTTLDHGRDETAIAVPFVKAEQFPLVTNVTTQDGRSIRLTKNMLKEIVRPLDLSRATVVDEAGLQSLKTAAQSIRALQKRYPQAAVKLENIAAEIERTAQVIESGNVLYEGRVVARADYDKQVAASRGKSIDITLNGRAYNQARLRSVADGKISIAHAGGLASIPLDPLTDEEIALLDGTSNGSVIKHYKIDKERSDAEREALAMQEEAKREEKAKQEKMNLASRNENLEMENERLRRDVEFRGRRPAAERDDGTIDGNHLRVALSLAIPLTEKIFYGAKERLEASQRATSQGRYLAPDPTKEELILDFNSYLKDSQKDLALLEVLLRDGNQARSFEVGITSLRAAGLSQAEADKCLASMTLYLAHEAADQE